MGHLVIESTYFFLLRLVQVAASVEFFEMKVGSIVLSIFSVYIIPNHCFSSFLIQRVNVIIASYIKAKLVVEVGIFARIMSL